MAPALASFPQFPNLPPELRIKIWEHTFEPRTVELRRTTRACKSITTHDHRGAPPYHNYHRNSSTCEEIDIFDALEVREHDWARHSRSALELDWGNANPMGDHVMDSGISPVARYLNRITNAVNTGMIVSVPDNYESSPRHLTAVDTVTYSPAVHQQPVALHVNRESRYEALRHYELMFALPGGTSEVYFNPDMDRLAFLAHVEVWRCASRADLAKVKMLSLLESCPDIAGNTYLLHEYESSPENFDHVIKKKFPDFKDEGPAYEQKLDEIIKFVCPSLESITFEPFYRCPHLRTRDVEEVREPDPRELTWSEIEHTYRRASDLWRAAKACSLLEDETPVQEECQFCFYNYAEPLANKDPLSAFCLHQERASEHDTDLGETYSPGSEYRRVLDRVWRSRNFRMGSLDVSFRVVDQQAVGVPDELMDWKTRWSLAQNLHNSFGDIISDEWLAEELPGYEYELGSWRYSGT